MMTNLGRGRKLRVFLEVASQIRAEVWKTEICNGLDPTMVARTLTERGMFQRVGDGFQPVRKIDGANKRVYVVTAKIFDGGGE